MGASVSASHVIFMVAAIIAATAVGAAMIGIAFSLAEDLSDNSDKLSDTMGTDIKIVNDPANLVVSNGYLSIYVLNTGDLPLNNEHWIVLINGRLVNLAAIIPQWGPTHFHGDIVELRVYFELDPGDHTVMVRYGDMAQDSMRFRVV